MNHQKITPNTFLVIINIWLATGSIACAFRLFPIALTSAILVAFNFFCLFKSLSSKS